MFSKRFKNVLLVAPDSCPRRLAAEYKYVKHISDTDRIFPVIFQMQPDLILLDYQYVQEDVERVVRRLRTNNFYNKIKICCYKNKEHPTTDELLKAIGVNSFIYSEDLFAEEEKKSASIFTAILEAKLIREVARVAN